MKQNPTTEAQLREHIKELESGMDGLWVVDLQGQLQKVNETYCQMSGYSRQELLAMKISELEAKENSAEIAIHIAKIRAESEDRFESVHRRKDGSTFPVEISVQNKAFDGSRLLVSIRDLTARKQAEEALRLMAVIINHMAEGVHLTRQQDGCICYTNPRFDELFGYAPGELLGQHVSVLNMPGDKSPDDVAEDIIATLLQQRYWTGEILNRKKNGEAFWCQASVSSYTHAAYGPIWISVHHDITERKRAQEENRKLEAQLQHKQKLESLGVLAGGIAHDFNNILVAMLGNAQLALAELPPASTIREYLADIESAAQYAAELCRQMLAYSGRGRFIIKTCDLSELVQELTQIMGISISKKAMLTYDFAPNLPAIEVDPTQVRQIVMNLITNASEALGGQSGTIIMRTGVSECDQAYFASCVLNEGLATGRYVYLEVVDSGCGMDADTRAKIFEPFFTTKFTGRGLGMAAVLGIMRTHQGAIQVTSKVGQGTAIRVLFPASNRPVEVAAEPSAPQADRQSQGTVLIVDDEPGVLKIAARVLEGMGLRALTASDGQTAVKVFGQHAAEIACVLLDFTMPDMDGAETLQALRQIRPEAPMVLTSGYSEEEISARFAGQHLAGFIPKPFEIISLKREIQKVLGIGELTC